MLSFTIVGLLDVSAQNPPSISSLTLSSTAYESVDLGDDCSLATLVTLITTTDMQPLTGQLELLSSFNTVASTTTCNITLNSEVEAATTTLNFICNDLSK